MVSTSGSVGSDRPTNGRSIQGHAAVSTRRFVPGSLSLSSQFNSRERNLNQLSSCPILKLVAAHPRSHIRSLAPFFLHASARNSYFSAHIDRHKKRRPKVSSVRVTGTTPGSSFGRFAQFTLDRNLILSGSGSRCSTLPCAAVEGSRRM